MSSPTRNEESEPSMSASSELRKREAGQALFTAFEEVLGVEGPAALARRTQRSKAWWCKLRTGKGGKFPGWYELAAEVLPPGLPTPQQDALRARHREAALLLDPEVLDERPPTVTTNIPVERLAACRDAARHAIEVGDIANASKALELLAITLVESGQDWLSREQTMLLESIHSDLRSCQPGYLSAESVGTAGTSVHIPRPTRNSETGAPAVKPVTHSGHARNAAASLAWWENL